MSKTKQRRGSSQRMVVNPYHRGQQHTGTILPYPVDPFPMFDPATFTGRWVFPNLLWILCAFMALVLLAIIAGVTL